MRFGPDAGGDREGEGAGEIRQRRVDDELLRFLRGQPVHCLHKGIVAAESRVAESLPR